MLISHFSFLGNCSLTDIIYLKKQDANSLNKLIRFQFSFLGYRNAISLRFPEKKMLSINCSQKNTKDAAGLIWQNKKAPAFDFCQSLYIINTLTMFLNNNCTTHIKDS